MLRRRLPGIAFRDLSKTGAREQVFLADLEFAIIARFGYDPGLLWELIERFVDANLVGALRDHRLDRFPDREVRKGVLEQVQMAGLVLFEGLDQRLRPEKPFPSV